MTDRPALTWQQQPLTTVKGTHGQGDYERTAFAGDVVNCPDCDGLGYTETTPDQPDCPTCRGSGRVLLNSDVYEYDEPVEARWEPGTMTSAPAGWRCDDWELAP